jgi:hypothetical protein
MWSKDEEQSRGSHGLEILGVREGDGFGKDVRKQLCSRSPTRFCGRLRGGRVPR